MIRQQKNELRKQMKLLKSQLSEEEKLAQSAAIFTKVEQLPVFQNANIVLLYWSMNDEVSTHHFIEKWWQKKIILLPTVEGDVLKIKQYNGKQSMKPGEPFGILEPMGEEFTEIEAIELIIIPGVAFGQNNNRMGRGKGYYDKLLVTSKGFKIGVCFNFQLVESIPVEEHDLPMDMIIKA